MRMPTRMLRAVLACFANISWLTGGAFSRGSLADHEVRQQRSPIDFITSHVDDSLELFKTSSGRVQGDCSSLQVVHDYETESKGESWRFSTEDSSCVPQSITFEGSKYTLQKLIVKTRSEHTLGGGSFEAELQLHHTNPEKETLVLVQWLSSCYNDGALPSPLLSVLTSSLLQGDATLYAPFSIYSHVLPVGDLSYLTYHSYDHPSLQEDGAASPAAAAAEGAVAQGGGGGGGGNASTVWVALVAPRPAAPGPLRAFLAALSEGEGAQAEVGADGAAAAAAAANAVRPAFRPRARAERAPGLRVRLFRHPGAAPLAADAAADTPQCELVAGLFAICMQVALAAVAVSSLVGKRFLERPRRPWRIWFFDVSKQGFGAGFVHCWNLVLATILSAVMADDPLASTKQDQCALYAMSLSIDIFLGTVWIYFLLKAQRALADRHGWEDLKHPGVYGSPPSTKVYLVQLWGYFLVLLTYKTLNAVIILSWRHHLDSFYTWVFSPLQPYPKLELVVVMVLLPGVLNVMQYWIVDNILKGEKISIH